MPVVSLMLTIGFCLALTCIVFFLREHMWGRVSSAERDSVLPLAEEDSRLAHAAAPIDSAPHGCDCHAGGRAPCSGCLRRG
jgi:hypothetical protein